MSSPGSRLNQIEFRVAATHPELLAGLDIWLRLGLLSDAQVKELCRLYLVCALPSVVSRPAPAPESPTAEQTPSKVAASPRPQVSPAPLPVAAPSFLMQILHSFMAELSVIWLLFLGVFLVVISSGVLAATQWQRFPAAGQYGVLLGYTLMFWLIGIRTGQQQNLRLTSRTLRIATLLLVPVNFWAMDTFGLWQQFWNWPVAGIAAITLSLMTWNLLKRDSNFQWPALNHLGLSYLHWGWGLAGFGLIAVYLGTIGTAIATLTQPRPQSDPTRQDSPSITSLFSTLASFPNKQITLIIYALVILLGRAIFVKGIPLSQLGLAIGICGALLAWFEQPKGLNSSPQNSTSQLNPATFFNGEKIGGLFLGFAWLVTVESVPSQALLISGLGLWFFHRRLVRDWQRPDFLMLFLIGLQSLWLAWRLVPPLLQTQLISTLTQLTNSQETPGALLGIILFPYLILTVKITQGLYRIPQKNVAEFSEFLAYSLGAILTLLSLTNPAIRTLNFLGSTVLLGYSAQRYAIGETQRSEVSTNRDLIDKTNLAIYLTQSFSVLTICSGIDTQFPRVSLVIWATLLLSLMLVEFEIFLGLNTSALNETHRFGNLVRKTKESAWHFGLVLAGISFIILNNFCTLLETEFVQNPGWCVIWLITPIALTIVAQFPNHSHQKLATYLSTAALFLAQLFSGRWPGNQLVSLGIAALVMVVNTHTRPQFPLALITLGVHLSFLTVLLREKIFGFPSNLAAAWYITGALIITGLWLFRWQILRKSQQLSQSESSTDSPSLQSESVQNRELKLTQLLSSYAQALDGWAIVLCSSELVLLALYTATDESKNYPFAILVSGLTILIASACRSWESPRQENALWLSIIAIIVAQFSLFPTPATRLAGLGVATGLMIGHSRYFPQVSVAVITLGFCLTFLAATFAEFHLISEWQWAMAGALTTLILWLMQRRLTHWKNATTTAGVPPNLRGQLVQIYAQATDIWAGTFSIVLLISLSVHSIALYKDISAVISRPSLETVIATVLTMTAIFYRSYPQPSPWGIYSLAWGLEILTAEILGFSGRELIPLAIANVILGLLIQVLGDWWRRQLAKTQTLSSRFPSFHIIPLLYAALGASLRTGVFASWTGLTTLAIALTALGVGRRQESFKPFVYLGLLGISASAYEILLYQMSQATKGAAGDGFILLATLGTSLVYAYRILSPWLMSYLPLTRKELTFITHLHWAWSSLLLVIATRYPIESNLYLGLGTGAFLVQYAIWQGRRHPQAFWGENWVYIGFVETLAIRLYWLSTPVAQFIGGPLFLWKTAVGTVFAYFLYILPWDAWGWSKRPWKVFAILIPLIALIETKGTFHPLSVLIAAVFYSFLAWDNRQIRFTYISIALINWVLLRWFWQLGFTQTEWYSTPLGLTVLYGVQVDPWLKQSLQKEGRHGLRLLVIGIICLVPLLTQQGNGLVAAGFSLVALMAGLALRIRAFLFVGTLIFMLNAFYQLVVLIFDYPFIKWVIGLAFGTAFIWIAATFETRRDRITLLIQQWITELQQWD